MKRLFKERVASILMLFIVLGIALHYWVNKEIKADLLLIAAFLQIGWVMYLINRKK